MAIAVEGVFTQLPTSPALTPFSTLEFSAVLLLGGKSTRMGSEKAMLLRDGKPLWQHQCQSLELAGAAEILISGRNDGPWVHEYRVVADRFPGQGPLGGIAAVLEAAQFDRVLVLAVDLPRMQPNFLRKLMEAGCVVPEHDGWFEPLAAVYPKSAAAMAERHLLEGKRSMQDFVRELIRTGQVQSYPLDSCDLALFENINTPDDYQRLNS